MEEDALTSRLVGMKLVLVFALLLLAFSGALVELVLGRRPALVTRSAKSGSRLD
jgi:hypothetical protein